MIRRHELTDQEWELLAPLIPRAATGRPRVEDRQVVNGMVYKIRTGISWRDLPERYGPWQTVYTRFRRPLGKIRLKTDPGWPAPWWGSVAAGRAQRAPRREVELVTKVTVSPPGEGLDEEPRHGIGARGVSEALQDALGPGGRQAGRGGAGKPDGSVVSASSPGAAVSAGASGPGRAHGRALA
ncbi:transposase [Streptomyces sp. NBC_00425]|uniref:transposase n=1 Tax=Streptomyces sp. NBC_00425 TaxID=2975740 RepID=UPI002E1F3A85